MDLREDRWFVRFRGHTLGPLTSEQVKSSLRKKELTDSDKIASSRDPSWIKIASVPEFAAISEAQKKTTIEWAPLPSPQLLRRPRAQRGHFAGKSFGNFGTPDDSLPSDFAAVHASLASLAQQEEKIRAERPSAAEFSAAKHGRKAPSQGAESGEKPFTTLRRKTGNSAPMRAAEPRIHSDGTPSRPPFTKRPLETSEAANSVEAFLAEEKPADQGPAKTAPIPPPVPAHMRGAGFGATSGSATTETSATPPKPMRPVPIRVAGLPKTAKADPILVPEVEPAPVVHHSLGEITPAEDLAEEKPVALNAAANASERVIAEDVLAPFSSDVSAFDIQAEMAAARFDAEEADEKTQFEEEDPVDTLVVKFSADDALAEEAQRETAPAIEMAAENKSAELNETKLNEPAITAAEASAPSGTLLSKDKLAQDTLSLMESLRDWQRQEQELDRTLRNLKIPRRDELAAEATAPPTRSLDSISGDERFTAPSALEAKEGRITISKELLLKAGFVVLFLMVAFAAFWIGNKSRGPGDFRFPDPSSPSVSPSTSGDPSPPLRAPTRPKRD